jgi:hypothetical protein
MEPSSVVRRRGNQDGPLWRSFAGMARILTVILSVAAWMSVPHAAVASGAAPAAPQVLVCAGTPVVRPRTMHWCTSMCSSYMTGIVWKSWSSSGATGVGTLMTNDGVPDCGQGTWTKHPSSIVILGDVRTAAPQRALENRTPVGSSKPHASGKVIVVGMIS